MSKRCPMCGSDELVDIVGFPGEFRCMSCGEELLEKHLLRETVFTQITASPEVLAEKLVYQFIAYDSCGLFVSCWRSTLTGDIQYNTKAEAIAATLAGLNALIEVR